MSLHAAASRAASPGKCRTPQKGAGQAAQQEAATSAAAADSAAKAQEQEEEDEEDDDEEDGVTAYALKGLRTVERCLVERRAVELTHLIDERIQLFFDGPGPEQDLRGPDRKRVTDDAPGHAAQARAAASPAASSAAAVSPLPKAKQVGG